MGVFRDVVARHGTAEQTTWLDGAIAKLEAPPEPITLRIALARAARKLPEEALTSIDAEVPGGPDYARWSLRDHARTALVLEAFARQPEAQQVELYTELLLRAEIGEQVSMLRMLPVLPAAERFVDAVIDVCRTNSIPVFEAIACENPFVATHFPEHNYNQLVMKAIFSGLDTRRIMGLPERVNAELVRMTSDFGDERRAAGRTVPDDINHIAKLQQARTE